MEAVLKATGQLDPTEPNSRQITRKARSLRASEKITETSSVYCIGQQEKHYNPRTIYSKPVQPATSVQPAISVQSAISSSGSYISKNNHDNSEPGQQ